MVLNNWRYILIICIYIYTSFFPKRVTRKNLVYIHSDNMFVVQAGSWFLLTQNACRKDKRRHSSHKIRGPESPTPIYDINGYHANDHLPVGRLARYDRTRNVSNLRLHPCQLEARHQEKSGPTVKSTPCMLLGQCCGMGWWKWKRAASCRELSNGNLAQLVKLCLVMGGW